MAQKCVHQGCGKEFTDPEEKCEYHPGPPIFHEGQKGRINQAKATALQLSIVCIYMC